MANYVLFRRFRIKTAILFLYLMYGGVIAKKQIWRGLMKFGATACRNFEARIKRVKEKTEAKAVLDV